MFFIVLDLRLQRLGQGVDPFFLSIRELGKSNEGGRFFFKGVQEIILGVQEYRSDASLRSSDDSFDYDARRRGGVCPPENTEHIQSLGQADPAPTAN